MYKSLEECILDLEKTGQLIRISEEVDPYLEMAAIHLKVFKNRGSAILFENIKGCKYRAVSNLFGNVDRSKYIFRNTFDEAKGVIALRNDPLVVLKNPFKYVKTGYAAVKALPWKKSGKVLKGFNEIKISDLPLIHHWPDDGGAFITLPQVYTENLDKPGIMNSNLGMYRIQLTGNDYIINSEVGMHYQTQRGIGVHHEIANKHGVPLKVSIFIGGPPSHTLAAIMPLPEGLSEMTFAGLLAGRRFRYCYHEGYCISLDADFVITGEISPGLTKPEGPFGDHIGYYSLAHNFPVMKVHKVYAKDNAIWPFTVVGRPPQEDTTFGDLVHELTGEAVKQEVPGVKEVHAVDESGVHPLLLAVGSERYTPYEDIKQPAEILTIANRILGTGHLSLAKYLFITAEDEESLNTRNVKGFLTYILKRIDLHRDIHFYTNTTIDTLDYSGSGLNKGSKVVFAAYGKEKRKLCEDVPDALLDLENYIKPKVIIPGVIAIQGPVFVDYIQTQEQLKLFCELIKNKGIQENCPIIIMCDDSKFMSDFENFLWAAFTRSNPSHDIYGVESSYEYKHWSCDNVIIDARKKPHHAPELIPDPVVEKNIERFFVK